MKSFKTLSLALFALIILLAGVSVLNAAGSWKNPTAQAPGNNVDAPINVGTEAQDKAGVLRVTGFRSFFDAIFDTKLQVGTTGTIPSNLTILSNGKVGAEAYCDRQGNNCVTSSGISVSSNASSTNTLAGDFNLVTPITLALIGTGPYYPTNGTGSYSTSWQSVSLSGKVPAEATAVLIGINGNCGEGFIRSNLDPVLPTITRNNSYVEPLINYRVLNGGNGGSSQRWYRLDSSKVLHFANLANGCDGGSSMDLSIQGWR